MIFKKLRKKISDFIFEIQSEGSYYNDREAFNREFEQYCRRHARENKERIARGEEPEPIDCID